MIEGYVNFVCDKCLDRVYYVEICCMVCECCVYFCWVIIRENEYCWFYEYGVCGCEVVFQGFLNIFWVIGVDGVEFEENDEKDGVLLVIIDGLVGSWFFDFGVDVVKLVILKKLKGKEREVISIGVDIF